MPEYKCTVDVTYRKEIKIFARDAQQAQEKAVALVEEWPGVHSADCDEAEQQ